jgi:hypothetical protein
MSSSPRLLIRCHAPSVAAASAVPDACALLSHLQDKRAVESSPSLCLRTASGRFALNVKPKRPKRWTIKRFHHRQPQFSTTLLLPRVFTHCCSLQHQSTTPQKRARKMSPCPYLVCKSQWRQLIPESTTAPYCSQVHHGQRIGPRCFRHRLCE